MRQGRGASGSWERPEMVLPEPRDGLALCLLGSPREARVGPPAPGLSENPYMLSYSTEFVVTRCSRNGKPTRPLI